MSLRIPGAPASAGARDSAINLIDTEILGEMASSLGHAGRKAEAALDRLHSCAADDADRPTLVHAAANAVYAYFVQREICGFRRHDDIIRQYRIPREVLVRLGAR